jgi:hypothetical protein
MSEALMSSFLKVGYCLGISFSVLSLDRSSMRTQMRKEGSGLGPFLTIFGTR